MKMPLSVSGTFTLPSPVRIGWIGTGVMGAPMCGHLFRAGYALTVYNRTPEKARAVVGQGARWAVSPPALAAESDVVCTMVGFPDDVRSLYLGPGGLLTHARPGQVFVDFTTSDPTLASELANLASTKGAVVLDAPVSGGEVGAQNASLSIMVGGDSSVFEAP